MSYSSSLYFVPVKRRLAELWLFNLFFEIKSLQADTPSMSGSLIFAVGRGQCIAMCNTLGIRVVYTPYNECTTYHSARKICSIDPGEVYRNGIIDCWFLHAFIRNKY